MVWLSRLTASSCGSQTATKRPQAGRPLKVSDDLPLKPVMVLSEGTNEQSGQDSVSTPVYYLGEMPGKGVSDGFKIDDQGLIWSSMPAGLCILDPKPPKPHVVAKAGRCLHVGPSGLA